MSSEQPIKIAIIGGGLAGATLANALLKHPHLDVHIFESAAKFSERGAAVGLAVNAQTALAEIGGTLVGVIERAGGVTMTSSRLCMASGPDAMSVLFDLAAEQRGKVVHRAALLAELLRPIPEGKKHTNKKVDAISESEETRKLSLRFSDGTEFQADAIIGADGVHGHVRGHVLGKDHPAVLGKTAGFWDARSLVSKQKARELMGEAYFEVDRQYGWIGDGGFFMHDVLDDGETVQFVVSEVVDPTQDGDDNWKEDEWSRKLNRTDLEKMVGRWTRTPTSLKKAIVEVMLQNPDLKAFAQQHHNLDAPTYAKGCVAIMGDAAHCMTPWQGSGAGQAIEDAMILDTLLEHVKTTEQLSAALQVYDQMRRPRTQRVVHSSAGTGLVLCGRGPDAGLDVEKIRETLPGRWGFIYTLDLAEHKREALAALKA